MFDSYLSTRSHSKTFAKGSLYILRYRESSAELMSLISPSLESLYRPEIQTQPATLQSVC